LWKFLLLPFRGAKPYILQVGRWPRAALADGSARSLCGRRGAKADTAAGQVAEPSLVDGDMPSSGPGKNGQAVETETTF